MDLAPLQIGCASGFSGDRVDGALPVVNALVKTGGHALIFETLAERTLALSQLIKNEHPDLGYEPLLVELLTPVLGLCLDHNIKIISNFGAANPPAAARRIRQLAQELKLRPPRIAILHGDQLMQPSQLAFLRERLGRSFTQLDIVSINAYQGAGEIALALEEDADIVVAGRIADPSLVVGPALAHFGWDRNDWHRLGCATMAGHLLECGTQVTGGYFAIPGLKDVDGMENLGFPIASINQSGEISITKAPGTGGAVTEQTVKEQLLYEIHNPAAYLTPDVTADISRVTVAQTASNCVAVGNVTGHERPEELKVTICHKGGWLAEAEISYAGVQAEARARLAADIVQRRIGSQLKLRVDLIGSSSILGDDHGTYLHHKAPGSSQDIRLRVAATHPQKDIAQRVLREVTALYTCGPAGGGGVRTSLHPRLNSISSTMPRDLAPAGWSFLA